MRLNEQRACNKSLVMLIMHLIILSDPRAAQQIVLYVCVCVSCVRSVVVYLLGRRYRLLLLLLH
jgi:hypothetical protein